MGALFDKIAEWLEGILVDASMDNLKSLFDSVNEQVSKVAGQVGTSPAGFSPSIFSMIRNISETVIMPIAGIILTFIACYELIQLVTEHNNLANLDLWIIFKWIFKTFAAVLIITNTFNIVMAVFDVAQHVIGQSGSLISGSTQITAMDMDVVKETLEDMELGGLLAVFLETFILKLMLKIMSAIIFVIIYGRMIEANEARIGNASYIAVKKGTYYIKPDGSISIKYTFHSEPFKKNYTKKTALKAPAKKAMKGVIYSANKKKTWTRYYKIVLKKKQYVHIYNKYADGGNTDLLDSKGNWIETETEYDKNEESKGSVTKKKLKRGTYYYKVYGDWDSARSRRQTTGFYYTFTWR